MSQRPMTMFERLPVARDLPRPPHCDPRILHLPEECRYCAEATELQAERVTLDVSNSGHSNRAWMCPADLARGPESYNKWHGNTAKTEDELEALGAIWRETSKMFEDGE